MSRVNRRPVSRRRLLTLLAILVVVLASVVFAVVVGWIGYLIPMVVLLVIGLAVLWVLVELVKRLPLPKRLPRGHNSSDWWQ